MNPLLLLAALMGFFVDSGRSQFDAIQAAEQENSLCQTEASFLYQDCIKIRLARREAQERLNTKAAEEKQLDSWLAEQKDPSLQHERP